MACATPERIVAWAAIHEDANIHDAGVDEVIAAACIDIHGRN